VTPAVLERPAPLFADRAAGAVSGGRVTLEERLNSLLHEVRANGSTDCPLCHERMQLTAAGAECAGCGSRLS
jgi:tRNA(Ile2) C34 agmatinyltransferase TiaS